MSKRNHFIFYRSFWDLINGFDEDGQLRLLTAVIEFGLDEKEPELKGLEQMAFDMITSKIRVNMKRQDNGKYGVLGAQYGKLGGRPRKDKNPQKPPKNPQTETPKNPQDNPQKTPTIESKNPQKPPKNPHICLSMNIVNVGSEKDNLDSKSSVSEMDCKENRYYTEEIDNKNILVGIDNINNNNYLDGMDDSKSNVDRYETDRVEEYDDLTFSEDFKRRMDKMQEFIEKFNIVTDHCGWPLEEVDWDKVSAEFAASSYLRSNPRYRSLQWIAYHHKTIEGGCFRPKNGPAVIEEQEKIEGNPFEDWK